MGWNGSGTVNRNNGVHSGTTVWAQDAAEPVNILSTRHDTHDEDIADAIENCIAKDGQNTATANLPMGGFKHTNVAVASARTDYARTSQVQDSGFTYAAVGGTANAITLTLSPAVTSYTTGLKVRFEAALDNTSSATLNVNGVGATAIKKISAENGGAVTDVVAADIVDNGVFECHYNGTYWILTNPATTTWTTWAPTLAAGGTMTYTGTSVNYAKYFRQGNKVWFIIDVSGTTGNAGHPDLLFTMPVTMAGTVGVGGGCKCTTGGTRIGGMWSANSTTQILVSKYDASNWALAANTGFVINGFVQSA